jgi:hypothetical protein
MGCPILSRILRKGGNHKSQIAILSTAKDPLLLLRLLLLFFLSFPLGIRFYPQSPLRTPTPKPHNNYLTQ